MNRVKIKKSKLIEKLTENLEKHDDVYNEAVDNYWKEVKETFEEKVEEAKEMIDERETSNGGINLSIYIEAPVSYKEAYVDTLAMLEYEVDDEVELTQNEFKSYVLNQWNWSNQFLTSNAMYASAGTMTNFSNSM